MSRGARNAPEEVWSIADFSPLVKSASGLRPGRALVMRACLHGPGAGPERREKEAGGLGNAPGGAWDGLVSAGKNAYALSTEKADKVR